ncbi:hypothetical protein [Rugamonas apoptosis]|uniref:Uncharacterized protein n=1 Tax=Rugamonas apoptosis TaxID=2758570 RepID=A0A7W2FCG2_9BURK|nr:hypothetical protein [Rugamonas apoptosis]MBA5689167.1 hypothetical protein [Rugamonas apoptosis]
MPNPFWHQTSVFCGNDQGRQVFKVGYQGLGGDGDNFRMAQEIGLRYCREIYAQQGVVGKIRMSNLIKKNHAQDALDAQPARHERIITAATVMSDSEKNELGVWEQAHATGDGHYTTSDWPGWDAVINRISH